MAGSLLSPTSCPPHAGRAPCHYHGGSGRLPGNSAPLPTWRDDNWFLHYACIPILSLRRVPIVTPLVHVKSKVVR